MTITRHIARSVVSTDWTLWVEQGTGTHAVLMDADNGPQVWVETSAGIAYQYGHTNGSDRVAIIDEDLQLTAWNELANAYHLRYTNSTAHTDTLVMLCEYDQSVARYAPHGHQSAGFCNKGTCDGYWQATYPSMIAYMIDTVLTDAGIDGDDSRTYLAEPTDLWSLALTLHNS